MKGVKQGDGASPELFLLYMDRVHPHIQSYMDKHRYTRSQRTIFTIACLTLFFLAFADDLVLIAPGVGAL